MKKLAFFLFTAALLLTPSFSQEPFTLIYWIRGTVADAPGARANGLRIYFANSKAWDTIGPTGASGRPNEFLINAGAAGVPLGKGARYTIFTESVNGHGAGPVELSLSGTGYDEAPPLVLAAGGGVSSIRALLVGGEPLPQIKFWFNNRLYNKELVDKGQVFFIPKKPKIKMEVKIDQPYLLSSSSANYTLAADNRPYTFTSSRMEGNKATFELQFTDELSSGQHTFNFSAQSSGDKASASTATESVKVTVAGGPLRLLDNPLTFPSPFDPERGKEVTLQYTLSDDANIDIFIFSIAGEVVKKISIRAGEEGGLGQLNKVKWNGFADQGMVASSGLYVGNIVARDENNVLGKFKLTIYR